MYAVLAGLNYLRLSAQPTNERITVHDSFPVLLLLKPCYEWKLIHLLDLHQCSIDVLTRYLTR